MVLLHKDLIVVCPFSERTYYRRIKSLKEKKIYDDADRDGNYLSQDEALMIADQLGFKKEFEEFIKQKNHEHND